MPLPVFGALNGVIQLNLLHDVYVALSAIFMEHYINISCND